MMRDYYLIAAILGLSLAAAILILVRRDHLYLRDGVFWIAVAAVSLLFGLWPPLLDKLGGFLGVAYSPALLFLIAIVVLVLRALLTDLALTAIRRDLRRLNQTIAVIDAESESGNRKG